MRVKYSHKVASSYTFPPLVRSLYRRHRPFFFLKLNALQYVLCVMHLRAQPSESLVTIWTVVSEPPLVRTRSKLTGSENELKPSPQNIVELLGSAAWQVAVHCGLQTCGVIEVVVDVCSQILATCTALQTKLCAIPSDHTSIFSLLAFTHHEERPPIRPRLDPGPFKRPTPCMVQLRVSRGGLQASGYHSCLQEGPPDLTRAKYSPNVPTFGPGTRRRY